MEIPSRMQLARAPYHWTLIQNFRSPTRGRSPVAAAFARHCARAHRCGASLPQHPPSLNTKNFVQAPGRDPDAPPTPHQHPKQLPQWRPRRQRSFLPQVRSDTIDRSGYASLLTESQESANPTLSSASPTPSTSGPPSRSPSRMAGEAPTRPTSATGSPVPLLICSPSLPT